MPELTTLTGARPDHNNGWHEPPGLYARPGHTNGWHEFPGLQAQAGLAGGWQVSGECTWPNPRVEGQSGGLVLVQFLAGNLCSLSLNVVFFLCIFLWLVVLFKPKLCFSCVFWLCFFCGKLCSLSLNVVLFVVLFFVGSCAWFVFFWW